MQIFHQLLAKLRAAGKLDLAKVLIDGGLYKTLLGGEKPVPTDRGRCGSKLNLMTSLEGVPLAIMLTPGNQHDIRQILPLAFLAYPHIGDAAGRPLVRPLLVIADSGCASRDLLDVLAACGVEANIP